MEKVKLFFKGFYHGLKSFGLVASTIVNFILLMVVYFIGVGVTSIVGKAFKKKFLDLRKNDLTNSGTYWMERKQKKLSIIESKRMF